MIWPSQNLEGKMKKEIANSEGLIDRKENADAIGKLNFDNAESISKLNYDNS